MSHLLQMRGLKLIRVIALYQHMVSHLLQMRGLKQQLRILILLELESHLLQMRGLKLTNIPYHKLASVASFTDAWIETCKPALKTRPLLSHLLQMRGLKLVDTRNIPHIIGSHLLQMRGLKL